MIKKQTWILNIAIITSFLGLLISICFIPVILNEEVNSNLVLEKKSDSPIIISHNDNFTLFTSTGNGSKLDPWIIEDYIIDATSSGLDGIHIRNTNDFFIIRNCTIMNADGSNKAGINFFNVTNGIISNNTIRDNYHGIYFENNSNILIINNTLDNIWGGIQAWDSCSDLVVERNTLINTHESWDYGLLFVISNNISIINNFIENQWKGIYFSSVHNSKINNNTLIENRGSGIILYTSHNITHFNNTIKHHENEYAIKITASNNSIIKNNTIINNGYGIDLSDTINTSISFNFITQNTVGIDLCNDQNVTISHNVITYQEYGIMTLWSINNIITNNTISYNTHYGLQLDRTNQTTIKFNEFRSNGVCVIELNCIGNVIEDNTCVKSPEISGFGCLFTLIAIFSFMSFQIFKSIQWKDENKSIKFTELCNY